MLKLAKSSLITRLHLSIGLVLLTVFTLVTWLDVRREEQSVNNFGDTQSALQRKDHETRIREAEQNLARKLALHLEMMADFAKAPLMNRVSEIDSEIETSNERIISDFQNCFALSARVLIVSCLKAQANDVSTMRTIASFNRLFIKTAAQHLVEDNDIVAAYVLDWEDKLYLGIRHAGQLGHATLQNLSEIDSALPKLEHAVLHDNEYLGKIVIVYNNDSIAALRQAADEQLKLTEQLLIQSTQLQANEVSQYRTIEGIMLFFVLLTAISWVSFTTIVKPLQQLKRSADQLARGQLNVDIDASRSDELGSLAQAFARMRDAIRESLREMEQQKELAQTTLASIGDGVITTHVDGTIRYLNPVAEAMTGWYTAQATGHSLDSVFRIIDENARTPLPDPISRHQGKARRDNNEQQAILLGPHGKEFAIVDNVAPIRDSSEALLGYVVTFHDVTEQRQLSRMLAHQATHDSLTGLVNRPEFERRVRNALHQTSGDQSNAHALCYIDLDQFKWVNDSSGHLAGDQLLIRVAHLMTQHIRSRDVLARLGGDEFGLLLEHCPPEQALKIVESMHRAIAQLRFAWDNKNFTITASMGLVIINPSLHTIEEIFKSADAACYIAKENGRNRIHVHQALQEGITERRGDLQWVDRINHAITANRLIVYCQPILPLGDSHPAHPIYELLVRLRGQEDTLISPGSFIAAAERYNVIQGLDRWMIRYAVSWLAQQKSNNAPLALLSINVSGHTLNQPTLAEFVAELLQDHNVSAEYLCLEFTESALLTHLPRATQCIKDLKKIGCRFMLDDFGGAFASLGYIKALPIDYLKLAAPPAQDAASGSVEMTITRAVNDIAHAMGISTIAKHVENAASRNQSARLGVDFAQGLGLVAPFPIDRIHAGEAVQLTDASGPKHVH